MAARKAKAAAKRKSARKQGVAAPAQVPAGQETGAVQVQRERSPERFTLTR